MGRSRGTAWMLAAAVVAAVFGGMAAEAADNQIKIGVVDVQKMYRDAPRIKQYMEDLDKLRESLALKLEIRGQNTMLDGNEIKELIDLKTKENPAEADKARIKTLEDTERAKDAELKGLQENKELNEQQKARLQELQDMQKMSKDTLNAIAKDCEDQWQTKTQEFDAKAVADLREAINKVAQDKGFTVVLDKAAVFFGGTDLTDDVIARLDREVQ